MQLACLDGDTAVPKIEGLIELFSGFPELGRKTENLTVDQISCLWCWLGMWC